MEKIPKNEAIPFYNNILDNICFSDYIDRITFQKQIWQFNEICSLIKTFYSNYILHNMYSDKDNYKINKMDIRFTKVLTKYSTEYNNSVFIQFLCQELNIDRKDLYGYFYSLKNISIEEIEKDLELYEITLLDINRILRYLDVYKDM